MYDLKEKLTCPRVKDENSTVYRFGCQVALKSLMDRHSVHIRIIDKPNNLVREQLSIILGIEIWFSWFT